MYTLDDFIFEIKDKKFDEISAFTFYRYINEINDDNFDLNFYKNFHQDLCDIQDIYCIFHYYNFGRFEKRIANEEQFLKIFPNFNFSDYINKLTHEI